MPSTITFGLVPHPPFEDRPIAKPEGHGQNNLGQRSVKGIVLHRMLGTLRGTDGYFRRADVSSLTDYGVGVGGHDADADDGVIIRWNDPLGHQAGWASGPVNQPYGDGLAFLTDYGGNLNVVNRDQASIETSGNYDTPLTEKSRASIVDIAAYWADQAQIPWNEFPIIPGKGYSFIRWHQEFCLGSGKVCPGSVVMGETNALIQRVATLLRQYQVAAAPIEPVYVEPVLPDWWDRGAAAPWPSDAKFGEHNFKVARRKVVATENAQRYPDFEVGHAHTGVAIAAGDTIRVERIVDVDGEPWIVEPEGHHVKAESFKPRIRLTAPPKEKAA